MPTRLSQDERNAVAQRIFAALCTHYPKHYIALIEPKAAANPPEQGLSAAQWLCRLQTTASAEVDA
jgi:hypothetical protein